MEEALLVIQAFQGWIYAILGLALVIYARLVVKWYGEYRRSIFGLERDHAASRLTRSIAMLALVALVGVGTFLVATFLGPSVPLAARPTPIPTISLLLTVPSVGALTREPDSDIAPASADLPSESGCLNPRATITSPLPGEELRGRIDVQGSADIASFAFYKIEVRADAPGTTWQAITAGTEPVNQDVLGAWDTRLAQVGRYFLRLVVTDTAGNAPLPCGFEVMVLPPEE